MKLTDDEIRIVSLAVRKLRIEMMGPDTPLQTQAVAQDLQNKVDMELLRILRSKRA